jgi:hypothetical protein
MHLEVITDHAPLLYELDSLLGDCGSPAPLPGASSIRCTATRLPGSPYLCLAFEGARLPDPIEAARTPFRMLRHLERYIEVPATAPGWRQIVNVEASNRLVIASDGRMAVIDVDAAPHEFVADCIVNVAEGAQDGVLFLHAASVGVSGAGALLIGRGHAGKSTTALTLAWRGNAFLGDDVAAVRRATRELLPFPKSAGLREGPLARLLEERVQTCRHTAGNGPDGSRRVLVRVSDLFPGSMSGPLPLRFAFVLGGFADRATVSRFTPGLRDIARLRSVASETLPNWGISPGRDLMKFLPIVNLLSGLRCYFVELGSPEETAALIEAVMEGA